MALHIPAICLVTDRQRMIPATDAGLVRLIASASAAGVDVIQIRERGRDDRELVALTRQIVAVSTGTRAKVIVNDRADIAIAAGAAGVHLRADSVPADRIRPIAPAGFLVGRSAHSVTEARAAADSGVDYLVMGTVYTTKSKPGATVRSGLSQLREVCRTVSIPVLAIGGISKDNVSEVAAAGAAGVAAIGIFTDIFNEHDHRELDGPLRETVAALRHALTRSGSHVTDNA
jgi:thiamine-phosphate diphosphorylase